jgi:superfamily II DNA or RNA helicase
LIFIKKESENFIKIESYENEVISTIENYFRYNLVQWVRNDSGRSSRKVSKISLLEGSTYLPFGLLKELLSLLKDKFKNEEIIVSKKLKPKKSKYMAMDELKEIMRAWRLPKKPRNYQFEGILNAYNKKRTILISPTSSGKSLIIYALAKIFKNEIYGDKKILIIVPRIQLVEQLFLNFKEYDVNCKESISENVKMIYSEYDKIILEHHKIVISTWQSLNNFKDDKFFKKVKYILTDEVHNSEDIEKQSLTTKCLIKIVRSCTNAKYRIGLTGTLSSENEEDEMLKRKSVEGLYGKAIQLTTSKHLQDKKYTPRVKIKGIIFDYGMVKSSKISTYTKELQYYRKTDGKIDFVINKLKKTEKNIIILFKTLPYGKRIFKALKKKFKNKRVWYIDGQIDIKDRLKAQEEMDKSDNNIIIGTFATFGEGISINNVFYLFMIEDIKSRQKVIQAIGRGMRLYKDKDEIIVYDMIDKIEKVNKKSKTTGIAYRHMLDRQKYYKEHHYKYVLVNKIKVRDNGDKNTNIQRCI